MLELSGLHVRVRHFWQPRAYDRLKRRNEAPAEQFLDLLRASVERRMMSDVPLGAQLSGGIDSTLIVRLANELSPFRLKTYSIGVEVQGYNELDYANQAALAVGSDHQAIRVGAADFDAHLDAMVWLSDLPIDHPNGVFLHILCKRAKEDVTVLLTGEGADEILAGYRRYASYLSVVRLAAKVPAFARRLVRAIPNRFLPWRVSALGDWDQLGASGLAIQSSMFGSMRLVSMLPPEIGVDLSYREGLLDTYSAAHPVEGLLRLDQQAYLGSVLQRQDRVSMGASVESRVPFLDHTLVEAANDMPIRSKLRRGCGKHVLKRVARGLIPGGIIDRRKMGFPVPLHKWFRKDARLSPRLDLLTDSRSTVAEILDRRELSRLVAEHRSGAHDHAQDLWILVSFELWYRRFIGSRVSL
ncbi:MAG: asparagine synthase C-terminal domain-containing protein [Planctomycetes bacterium]|nr:asparagine synthase C-terminal domain-containing protein [Planctomycetota bacterium]